MHFDQVGIIPGIQVNNISKTMFVTFTIITFVVIQKKCLIKLDIHLLVNWKYKGTFLT